MSTLNVTDLSKSYGDNQVLEKINLTVDDHSILGLLGRNGAGKTTLLSIIAGIVPQDSGHVSVCSVDKDSSADSGYEDNLGVCAQELAIYPTLKVIDNFDFFSRIKSKSTKPNRSEIDLLLEAFELGEFRNKTAGQLSGGQQRRLHAAIAMLGAPACLLLDEPTAGADPESRKNILDYTSALASERGCAIVYTSHYTAEVETIATTLAVLDKGRVIEQGPTKEVIARVSKGQLRLSFETESERPFVLVVDCAQPSQLVHSVLERIGDRRDRLVSMEIIQPSLDTLFLTDEAVGDETLDPSRFAHIDERGLDENEQLDAYLKETVGI